ncbi:Asp-tRNA(Asn)/Glu-tRNA(Gln) amidotransferase subunit GatC [Thioflexithrix psekupsensis]|uniref:Aspartyl/glutamyl-tRNA(Asn/Gln) amidotransferase subunit C n=1 Tax=Thioflexithrix psekupsensis TaxID=1570016 RepID=A0A251X7I3_9GAMM|nr:Asp-tRNA(Asn)/Glu-tRNA(Gln) amidotransferase subunit GatC [Thioflexithrix psekupsensis]OUD13149.1 asparaginyl/glutamyl-tRNA amidotransferase subunit C [Thioflexithrix psekupsensis]
MSLQREQVEKIAHLARIQLTEDDIPRYTDNLSSIFDFVEQLNSVNTEGIVAMAHPLDAVARLRPDMVTETDQRSHFQAHAPSVEAGLYLVPKVIE